MKKFLVLLFVSMLFWSLVIAQTSYVSLKTSYSITPETLEPGDNGNLILKVSNSGTTYASNVKIKFLPNTALELYKTKYNLETIPSGDSKQIVVPFHVLETAPYGTVALMFEIEYSVDDSPGTRTMDNAISLTITRRPIIEITNVNFSEEEITPGKIFKMKIEMKNVGKGDAKDVILAIDTSNVPIVPLGKSSEIYVGDIEKGSSKEVTITFIVNDEAEIKAYRVPVTLTYHDELSKEISDEKEVGFRIWGEPELIVSMDETKNLVSGDKGSVSFLIANKGVAKAKYLTLKLQSTISSQPHEVYVGNVDPDDYETADFSLDLRNVKPGTYKLNLSIEYKDAYNNLKTETREFSINVGELDLSGVYRNNLLVLIALILALVYWKRKSIKKFLK